uniref:Uncharacterized protein n=1 Tax=Periophthalmus magnuspinnatus TaxID=409849 RepID=A0A3B4AXS9_9GOBI
MFTVLSALYPPFQVTSPTVLCQVLSVVERCYRGDGLRYLLHFLLPAKQFLQSLQQDACLPYCGLLFRHEGWPLCLHEKIVIQLCHLDQHLLRPGDFYLLVSPSSSSSSSSSASSSHHSSSRSEIPELALSSVFTMAWLDSVNRDREERGMSRMERLLLSAHGDVFRVPWEDLVYPQFVSRPRASLKDVKDASFCSSVEPDTTQEKTLLSTLGQGKTPLPCSVNKSTPSSDDSDSEGEYVELTELALPRFSPQKGSLTQLISQQHRARTSTQTSVKTTTQQNVPAQFQNTPKHLPAIADGRLSTKKFHSAPLNMCVVFFFLMKATTELYYINYFCSGPNAVHPKPGLSNGSIPKPPETASLSVLMSLPVPLHLSKSPQSRFNRVLLSSGVLCLPGEIQYSYRYSIHPSKSLVCPFCSLTTTIKHFYILTFLLYLLLYYYCTNLCHVVLAF